MKLDHAYKYDLSLEEDGSRTFLVWILASLFYIASLALIGFLSAQNMLDDWQHYSENQLTIEIPYSQEAESKITEIEATLSTLSEVKSARHVPIEETTALIRPILGEHIENLALPLLIDVTLQPNRSSDGLKELLHPYDLGANIQHHTTWSQDMISLGQTLYVSMLILLAISLLITAFTLIWAITSRIHIHKDEIDILSIVGANDEYIAAQLQHFALKHSVIGCGIGFILALISYIVTDIYLLPDVNILGFGLLQTIIWMTLPMGAYIVISILSAHLTLKYTLITSGH